MVTCMVFNANLQQYFSYIMTASFIGGGNRGKPPICRNPLTNLAHNFVSITPRHERGSYSQL